jgi:hypothetical protein
MGSLSRHNLLRVSFLCHNQDKLFDVKENRRAAKEGRTLEANAYARPELV